MKMEWPVEEAQQDTVTGEESRNLVIMDQDQGRAAGCPGMIGAQMEMLWACLTLLAALTTGGARSLLRPIQCCRVV